MKSIKHTALVSAMSLAMAVLLSSCASLGGGSRTVSAAEAFSRLDHDTNYYEELADDADEQSVFAANLLLARSYIVNNQQPKAQQLLDSMKAQTVSALQLDEISIIEAMGLKSVNRNNEAALLLNRVNATNLPAAAAIYYYQLNSNVLYAQYGTNRSQDTLLKAYQSKKALLDYVNTPAERSQVA